MQEKELIRQIHVTSLKGRKVVTMHTRGPVSHTWVPIRHSPPRPMNARGKTLKSLSPAHHMQSGHQYRSDARR